MPLCMPLKDTLILTHGFVTVALHYVHEYNG